MTGSRYYREAPPAGAKPQDWRHRARCRDEDPELFFPVGTGHIATRQIEEAKAVCRRCPVVTECLNWALTRREDAGVWGGTSEDERKAILAGNRRISDPEMAEALRRVRVDRAADTERIRTLAAAGYSDTQIAGRMGYPWTGDKVADRRRSEGITAGRYAARPQALDGAA